LFIKSTFANKTIKLTFSSFISQIVPLLFYPIFTRIYTPEDFGLASTFLILLPLFVIISSGTYELAILNTNKEIDSINIISYIVKRSFLILIFFQIIFFFFGEIICIFFNQINLFPWIHLIPLTAFFTIITIIYNEWLITNNNFNRLGSIKIINSTSVSFSKFILGLLKFSTNGLILGEFIGRFISATVNLTSKALPIKKVLHGLKFKNPIIKDYNGFGKWTMSEQLISNLGGALPNLFIGIYFSNKELGYFALSGSILTAPITVVTISIRDVFRNKVSENIKNFGNCSDLFLKLLKKVILIGFLGFTLLFILLPYIVNFGLGENWEMVTNYSLIQIPMFFLSFISMSLSGVLIIGNKLKQSFVWQIYYTLTTFFSLIVGIYYFKTIELTLVCLVIGRSSAYLLYLYLSYMASKG
jgi:O-antigen/teichoic acid export membrane protein